MATFDHTARPTGFQRRCAHRLAGLALLTFVTLAAACNSDDVSGVGTTATTADRSFIDGMVPHHGMATLSADMAIARANHAELRAFAQKMKDDQTKEIAQLTGWKKAWFGTDSVPTPMMPRDIPAGAGFDLEWIKMMVTHHQGAVDMSILTLSADARSESDSLAQHIITEQRAEQAQLRVWAQQWYGATFTVAPLP